MRIFRTGTASLGLADISNFTIQGCKKEMVFKVVKKKTQQSNFGQCEWKRIDMSLSTLSLSAVDSYSVGALTSTLSSYKLYRWALFSGI